MRAGQAHWQNGIVERHIGTFKTALDNLLLGRGAEITEDQPQPVEQLGRLVSDSYQFEMLLKGSYDHPHING